MASTDALVKALAAAEAAGDQEAIKVIEGELRSAAAKNPSTVVKAGKEFAGNAGAGAGQTVAAGMPMLARMLQQSPLGQLMLPKGGEQVADAESQNVRRFWKGQEGGEVLPKDLQAFARGVGATAVLPNPINAGRNLALGGLTEVAGERGTEMAGPMGGLTASLITGLGGGYALNRPSPAAKALHDASKTIPAGAWDEAGENLSRFRRLGAQTDTLADLFPASNALRGLAATASGSKGGESLALRLGDRDQDIQRITTKALDAIGPQASPQKTALLAAEKAAESLAALRRRKNLSFERTMQGARTLGQDEVKILDDALAQMAQGQSRPGARDAFLAMREALLDANAKVQAPGRTTLNAAGVPTQVPGQSSPAYITNPQQLSLAVNAQKSRLVGPKAPPDKAIDAEDWRQAQKLFDDMLRTAIPEYGKAMSDAAKFNAGPRAQARLGPRGTLTGASEVNPQGPVSPSRLQAITSGQDPKTVVQTLRALDAPGGDLSKSIMRSILEARVRKTGETPSVVLMGGQGMPEEATRAGLRFAGTNQAQFDDATQAADLLSQLSSRADTSRRLDPSPLQAAAEPFGTTRRLIGGATEARTMQEISELLANPTFDNFRKLRALAASDPRIAAQISYLQALRLSGQQAQEQPE